MKVGVDARALTRSLTGIGRYTLEMCKVLAAMPNLQLSLYSPSPIISQELLHVNLRTGRFHSNYARQIWAETVLPAWIKQDNLDVFWGPAHCLPRLLPKKVASVVTIHDLVWKYAKETMRPVTRILEQFHMPFAIKAADRIVADSMATAKAVIQEFHTPQDCIEVITPGVTAFQKPKDNQLLQKLGVPKDYFLFVGTLEPRKNLQRLLQAYALLPQALKEEVRLVIAGGQGWGKLELEKNIAQLKLQSYVHLTGYIDEDLLPSLYAHARFLAMPSLYEGFGLPLVEAMSLGIPVLTSNNSSMPEVCGDAGYLIDPYDLHSIEKGLLQLLTNNTLVQQLQSKAKLSAARFNWTDSGLQLARVFKETLSQKTKRINQ